jgi:hypothetical protein
MVHKLLNAGADVNIAENVKKSCYNFFPRHFRTIVFLIEWGYAASLRSAPGTRECS